MSIEDLFAQLAPGLVQPTRKDRQVFAEAVNLLFEESVSPRFGTPAKWTRVVYGKLSKPLLRQLMAEDGWMWFTTRFWQFVPLSTAIEFGLLVKQNPIVGIWLRQQYQMMQKWWAEDQGDDHGTEGTSSEP